MPARDFHRPTVNQMEEFIERLTAISRDIKGSDFSRKEGMKMISVLRKAEKGQPID